MLAKSSTAASLDPTSKTHKSRTRFHAFEVLSSASSMQYIRSQNNSRTERAASVQRCKRFTVTQKGLGNDVWLYNEVLEVN